MATATLEGAAGASAAGASTPELADIQGILASGYAALDAACYVLLNIRDGAAARSWLRRSIDKFRWADARIPQSEDCAHIAFSYPGLVQLGLPWQALKGFSREFQEGMAGNERRSRVLGDVGTIAPEHWDWGGPPAQVDQQIHALVLLYASDGAALERLYLAYGDEFRAAGLHEVKRLGTLRLTNDREHFGFRDGISDVKIQGLSHVTDKAKLVRPGEFILGYPNEHGTLTTRPLVDPIEDPESLLPPDAGGSDQRDFGRNGSYLVFRQLSQDVSAFTSFVAQASRHSNGVTLPAAEELLAAKMVGRWKNGAPLVLHPAHPPQAVHKEEENDFLYHREDRHGLRCPIGAHIRRTNPRDSLAPDPGTPASLTVNKRHQLLRRGRTYGRPLDAELSPQGDPGLPDEERGLHFICFNANIGRQFEFVQHTWANNPNFSGLYADPDPLIGYRRGGDGFTIPSEATRTSVTGLPRFVTVKGGGYFFLPGKRALRYLASDSRRRLANAYNAPASPASQPSVTLGLQLARWANRRLERLLIWTRRFVRLRAVFDGTLGPLIKTLVQWLIRRSRPDAGLGIAEERELPDEAQVTQRIAEQMTEFLFRHYRTQVAERAGNTKTYGLVKGVFEIDEDLPDELRSGLFKEPRKYDAWVRFGGPGPLVVPDMEDNGILSIGVKLMGVEGEKLIDDERSTVDFTGISAPTFTTPNVIENLKLQQHLSRGTSVFYFLNPFDSHYLDAIMQGLYAKAHANPLQLRYWSCVPYLFGDGRAVKFSFVPTMESRTRVPRNPSDDYLREAMVKTLAQADVEFDFKIQFQTDPRHMPVEDASVAWPESVSPFIRVAKLRIPQQNFATEDRDRLARSFTFNPWHTISAHRPLGNQNRARKSIYLATSSARQQINREQKIEPQA